MSKSSQVIRFISPPRARAIAITGGRNQHRIVHAITWSLLSATAALWMAYLPILMGHVLTLLNVPF